LLPTHPPRIFRDYLSNRKAQLSAFSD